MCVNVHVYIVHACYDTFNYNNSILNFSVPGMETTVIKSFKRIWYGYFCEESTCTTQYTLMWLANSFKYTYYRYTRFDQTTTLFAHYAVIVCASIALSLSLSSLTFPVMMKSLLQINWIYCLFSVRLAFGCLVLTKYSLWSTTAHYAVKFLQKQRQREDEWESRWGKER